MPDMPGVLANPAGRREFTHACYVRGRYACPVRVIAIGMIDFLLAVYILSNRADLMLDTHAKMSKN
jgi:hypothetical protein